MNKSIKHGLIIGNGINCLSNKYDECSWASLLKYIENEYNITYVSAQLGYPMLFECIINKINQRDAESLWYEESDKAYSEVKRKVAEYLKKGITENISDSVAEIIRNMDIDCIITTNYDPMIERIYNNDPTKIFNHYAKNTRYLFKHTSAYRKKGNSYVKMYHMHGIWDEISTMCLGYEHYSGIVSNLRSYISKSSNNKEEDMKIIKHLKGEKTTPSLEDFFVTRFFDTNLSIIGLGLDDHEIDIWWILVFRAYLYYSNVNKAKDYITNKITYYEIGEAKKDEKKYEKERRFLFENMHVKYERVVVKDNYTEKYIEVLKTINGTI